MRSFLRALSLGGLAVGLTAFLIPACSTESSGTGDLPTDDASIDETGETGDDNPVCGNGAVEGVEQCDDGNSVNGDGCENTCIFSCKPDTTTCDDGNACNGTETCGATHTCSMGTALADGASCGTGKLCKGGVCIDSTCGDAVITAPEECDDGNVTDGDGCNSCKFSCLSTDSTRNCSGGDPCAGASTCNDATHTCSKGTPLADGADCGGGKVCKAGVCGSGSCGDGIVTAPEQCDFGSGNGAGTGCEIDCKFSCSKTADTCSDGDLCNGVEACKDVMVGGKTGQKCAAGTAAADGTASGTGNTCKAGVCASATCGNGTLDTGEDCDFGAGNGPGTGCEKSCKFSCTKTPTDSCSDGNACNGVETCGTVTVSGKTGQKCSPGTALAACASCGTGGVCITGTCKTSTCGDMCIDSTKGETCDPPGAGTCDATCKTIVAAVCGNGIRETGETCDDSGKLNLDGCDAVCKFEQDQRADAVTIQTATDTFCTINALGGAVVGNAASQLNTSLATGVKDGSINIMFKFLDLDDLTGTADPSIRLGSLGGSFVMPPTGVTYDGTNAVDWWYTVDPLSIDATRTPLATLAGSIAAKALTAGPGTMNLVLTLGGAPTPVKLTNVKLKATVGATSTPKASTGATPGHLASEHLDPALKSFETLANGELCGNVSAASLSKAPAPSAITGGGAISCVEGYTTANSLLDVLVGGCKVLGGFVVAVKATQPDQVDAASPPVGGGGPYKLSVTGSPPKVTGCKDKGGATVDLTKCLDAAAYSSFFKFTTDRAIVK
jgi:cysteine-rich repeat protein